MGEHDFDKVPTSSSFFSLNYSYCKIVKSSKKKDGSKVGSHKKDGSHVAKFRQAEAAFERQKNLYTAHLVLSFLMKKK
jgi:hypothetical protein